MKKGNKRGILLSLISVAAFFGIWYLCTKILGLLPEKTLPDPVKVFTTFIDKFTNPNPDGGTLLQHTGASLQVALTGYITAMVIGIPLGILMAWNKYVDRFVRPLFDLIKPIPGVAWIPLMIVIFGIGLQSKAAVVFFSAVVPCISYGSSIHNDRGEDSAWSGVGRDRSRRTSWIYKGSWIYDPAGKRHIPNRYHHSRNACYRNMWSCADSSFRSDREACREREREECLKKEQKNCLRSCSIRLFPYWCF